MKNFILISLVLGMSLSFSARASYVNLNTLVLGVSLDPDVDHYSFPCTIGPSDVVLCGGNVSIEDMNCEKSLKYTSIGKKAVDISCQLSDGRNVVLARAQGELSVDETQDAFGYVNLQMNSSVTIKAVSGIGTRVKYPLIVK